MSDKEINIAIAEVCGWKFTDPPVGGVQTCDWQAPGGAYRERCPNYCGDLNAMHEAASSLDIVSRRVFAETLMDVCEETRPGDVWGDQFCIQNATARQRAEAFLRAVGKWRQAQ